uniref:Uncharacterized protein n=1 Tax=Bombyx mori TaxID=7091 RepID=A0A8R2LW37_BOMMO|nr:uncharacterized protein LOC119628845 isoform X5 [Bombyx mori]
MTEQKELIKKRSSIKGRLTAFASHLKTIDESTITATEVRAIILLYVYGKPIKLTTFIVLE